MCVLYKNVLAFRSLETEVFIGKKRYSVFTLLSNTLEKFKMSNAKW